MAALIVIDPGHGGADPGASGNGLKEKDITLSIAKRVAKHLENMGVNVCLTRSDDNVFSSDKAADLKARAEFANRLDADYFISIHINAGGGTGFESYVAKSAANQEAGRCQHIVHSEVASVFTNAGLPDRGEKTANFAVLRQTSMPAILLEFGFVDYAKDVAQLKNPEFLNAVAEAVARGTARALHVENPAPSLPASSTKPISKYYKDILPGLEWAGESVDKLYEFGIMRGDGQGAFRPTDTMTRLEAAVAIHNTIEYLLKKSGTS
ncbi:N-acetylmuramoyl-L-alanine amidase [Aneurinibacillus sp. REN35]|uniref:N-acetylmuramoyl-L-alanine amidase n=1 Tax=Aneurinibacillus sp. REN35 TaxID=3237286 RepID=UPI0035271F47